MESDSDSGSDYAVEDFVRPSRIAKRPVNDESADLLGNFDAAKRKKFSDPSLYDHGDLSDTAENDGENEGNEDENGVEDDNSGSEEEEAESEDSGPKGLNTHLSSDQVETLLKGARKKDRYVLYVTNLNFETSKESLENFFSQAGPVKAVRIPPKMRGGFAFVEMTSIEGFQKALEFHEVKLDGRKIKVQISEGGKKKSANKKNILRQKNRKLAEMRNEKKSFGKSGKNYDKNIKKEKAKEMLLRKRWRKKPAPRS